MLHIEIAAEKIFSLFGLPITNTLLTVWAVLVLLIIAAVFLMRRLDILPSGLQNIFEVFVEKFLSIMGEVFGSRERAEKYFPLVATIFIFVLVSNWIGIFPGIGSIGFYEESQGRTVFVPFFRSAASDINFTIALAVVAVTSVHIFGISSIGVFKHISKFISFRGPIEFFVGVLELISDIAKMVSFSFRLFGNVFAGEVLLIIVGFLVPYFVPVPFLLLEIFVGFIQALVFSMLTMVFISIAVQNH